MVDLSKVTHITGDFVLELSIGVKLSDVSPDDKPWDRHKKENAIIGGYYAEEARFYKYAVRMSECAPTLVFGQVDVSGHEKKLKLTKARFCRVRHCPVCAWRKSLATVARFYRNLPAYLEQYSDYKYIHISLTVKNPVMNRLKETVQLMNGAWKKMLKRKEVLKIVNGYIKSIEVTHGNDDNPHPHIHAILAVNKSYFTSRDYIKHEKWVELWRSCLGVDYNPQVNVKKVRASRKLKAIKIRTGDKEIEYTGEVAGLIGGVIEVMKYDNKPADVVDSPQFLYGITEQLFKMRFMETGGCFKNIFKDHKSNKKDDEITEDEMLLKNENGEKCGKTRFVFGWRRRESDYVLGRIFEEEGPPGGGFNGERGG